MSLADLHDSLMPLLEQVLPTVAWPPSGLLLDLACGSGLKWPLLAAAGPGLRPLALDCDLAALRACHTPGRGGGWAAPLVVAGDALALPLQTGCCAAACCIAALGLFADGAAALRELRRVLVPAGPLLVVTATQLWVQLVAWPAELAAPLADAYAQALARGAAPPTSPDVVGELCGQLAAAGFAEPCGRAFLLEAAATPLLAELPLLPWPALRPLVAGALAPAVLAACDTVAAKPMIELCPVGIVVQGLGTRG